jgi:hypothetical protein
MESIDRKFRIHAVNRATGIVQTDGTAILLLAKDNAVPATLHFYRNECERLGALEGHLQSVELLIKRVDEYREKNSGACKVPDMSQREQPIQIKGELGETYKDSHEAKILNALGELETATPDVVMDGHSVLWLEDRQTGRKKKLQPHEVLGLIQKAQDLRDILYNLLF